MPPDLRSAPRSLARTSVWLLYAEEDRYRLLARNMTDVITRHGRNGAVHVRFAGRRRRCSASKVNELHGHGLFDRVHVADRPAYLTALARGRFARRSAVGRIPRRAVPTIARPVPQFIWVEMRCRPLDQAAGEPSREREVVAVMRDVTERKTQEEALEHARAEAEHANAAKTPVPGHHEPRIAHAAQRHYRLLRDADRMKTAMLLERAIAGASTPS